MEGVTAEKGLICLVCRFKASGSSSMDGVSIPLEFLLSARATQSRKRCPCPWQGKFMIFFFKAATSGVVKLVLGVVKLFGTLAFEGG